MFLLNIDYIAAGCSLGDDMGYLKMIFKPFM